MTNYIEYEITITDYMDVKEVLIYRVSSKKALDIVLGDYISRNNLKPKAIQIKEL
jgi:hypothetical protein